MIDRDTRFFIEIDIRTMKVLGHSARSKYKLDKGRQTDPKRHRLFLTPGQYRKFVDRCAPPALKQD